MLILFLTLLVATLALMLFLYVGALFLQGYYYTEPSETLFWGAPAAGFALGLFWLLWCLLIVNSPGATPDNIPYDTLARFSPKIDMHKDPVLELFAIDKKGVQTHYKRHKVTNLQMSESRSVYRTNLDTPTPWRGQGVEKIVIVAGLEKHEFKLVPPPKGESSYREFVSDQGWVMREWEDGPNGIPYAYRWGRFFANMFLNFFHLGLWFAVLWLLLRFQWSHALGLAFCLWLMATIVLLPMLLTYAASVAAASPS